MGTVIVVAVVAVLPMSLDRYWAGLVAAGIALSIALLSYSLVTGEGGMVWLCQITFAGIGAVLAAELVGRWHWPPLLAVIVGAAFVVPIGVILGMLTIRLGNLYVALVTLTFGLLVQTLVLTQDPFYNFGSGAKMPRPTFAKDNMTFAYLTLAVFLILGVLILNVRRSTAGLAMSAVRFSENGAKTLGISVIQTKVLVSGLATYVAAVGGGFLAMNLGFHAAGVLQPVHRPDLARRAGHARLAVDHRRAGRRRHVLRDAGRLLDLRGHRLRRRADHPVRPRRDRPGDAPRGCGHPDGGQHLPAAPRPASSRARRAGRLPAAS